MKAKIIFGLFLILICGVLHNYPQDGSFVLTTTATQGLGKIDGVRASIDHPALNGNPDAVIFLAQKTGAVHPTGVWYLNGKWYVVNRNQEPMAAGKTFQITFWTKPDALRFVHIVDYNNLKTSVNGTPKSVSYLNHPALDNFPNAVFEITQSTAGVGNANTAKSEYDYALKKWYLVNENGAAMLNLNRYNINIFNSGTLGGKEELSKPEGLGSVKENLAASKAGGDLGGYYPYPTVVGLQGKPLSNIQPKIGDTLKWDGAQWTPTTTTAQPITQPTQSAQPAPPGGGMQTFIKQFGATKRIVGEFVKGNYFELPELSHSIVLQKKSRLIITGDISVKPLLCTVGCAGTDGMFLLAVNATFNNSGDAAYKMNFAIPARGYQQNVSFANFMIDLNPGNHNIRFYVTKIIGWEFDVIPSYSSIIVIPLE